MINNDFSAASPIIFSTRPTLLSSISIEPAADNDSKEFLKQVQFNIRYLLSISNKFIYIIHLRSEEFLLAYLYNIIISETWNAISLTRFFSRLPFHLTEIT